MSEWLEIASGYCVTLIDAMALVIIFAGTVEAFVKTIASLRHPHDGFHRREVWLRFARWLVAGLTFQLAADIIESATAPSWDDIGRLAAVAVIRTFLNYFLDRDMTEIGARQLEARKE